MPIITTAAAAAATPFYAATPLTLMRRASGTAILLIAALFATLAAPRLYGHFGVVDADFRSIDDASPLFAD